ncbi:DUF551 domain-containing protein [Sporomusa malonica]|uniref:Uncharacterized protein n=1 Tax=Sporomusa malonica TaxID=112901 RepID=A0A1W2ATG3_9FIRM|nr:DUF551 domain-containing protein [Sporomusa malonica]SMC63874.1 Protein of unknown function [Sporomusa malonica]
MSVIDDYNSLLKLGINEVLRLAKLGAARQWVSVGTALPENKVGKYGITEPTIVLCTDGKEWYKAYYVKNYEINIEDMGYDGDTDIDENGEEYWPEGWYECSSENEDTDWALGAKITHWQPLPPLPEVNTQEVINNE